MMEWNYLIENGKRYLLVLGVTSVMVCILILTHRPLQPGLSGFVASHGEKPAIERAEDLDVAEGSAGYAIRSGETETGEVLGEVRGKTAGNAVRYLRSGGATQPEDQLLLVGMLGLAIALTAFSGVSHHQRKKHRSRH